ncbi:RcgA family putative transporter [Phaeobacter piscinae]|uniref:RcgA family putative transporter n=1 Tax=Phaeobacter piscinae TaxID=1580596 RepID=UPI000BBEC16B|nr:hypothetical protein [Phaeobacter piscinae]ATG41797.1 hypothetical protein PhaeoP14_03765 [Phaeobacter piscinae]AUR38221.1 hypothetical protein PhaeoP18_04005 [Phaeobacter piscinae]
MIKKGKFFQSPPKSGETFKELFIHATTAGVGRPANKDGYPIGPWTPELLADAISQIDANRKGVDLRTVQLWFEHNKRGIGPTNIRWLSMVFGCRDPEGTSEWQVELSASQSRLKARRKQKEKAGGLGEQPAFDVKQTAEPQNVPHAPKLDQAAGPKALDADNVPPKQRFNLARASEALFSSRSTLNLPALVWAGWVVLGFLTYIMGVHSVTYSPIAGLHKQVGFFWAPNWSLIELVILPLFLVTVVGLLAFWKAERRLIIASTGSDPGETGDWTSRVESFSYSHWAVFFICFAIVFLVQWSGIHMRALVNGDVGNLMMDWNLLAIVRPEVISVPEATVLSMLAFLYTAAICFLFLTGLVLMYTLTQDFFEVCSASELHSNPLIQSKIGEVGTELLCRVYRASLLGIWVATCIKLQATYLLSDGESILDWLLTDALFFLGIYTEANSWIGQRSLAHFTSFLLLFATCSVFIFGYVQTCRVVKRAFSSGSSRRLAEAQCVHRWMMMGVVMLLIANFFLIGQISGFSILLIVGTLATIYSLYDPMFGRAQASEMTT